MTQVWTGVAAIRRGAVALAAIAAVIASGGLARADTLYDGYWNVSIVTLRGACDRSASVSVSIRDGRIDGANGALVGSVGRNGALRAMIGGGDSRASASGRLAGAGGGGGWSGIRNGGPCSGRWSAQKM